MFFIFSKIITFLIDPLSWILFVLLILIFRKTTGKSRIFLLICYLAVYILSIPFSSDKLFGQIERLVEKPKLKQKYDAVIVLSGMVDLANSDSNNISFGGAVERILTGINLVKTQRADKLIISGGSGELFPGGKSEAALLKSFALKQGLKNDQILLDLNSRNTFENAKESLKIVKGQKLNSLILVTSAFHMYRSLGCFKQVGLTPEAYPVDYKVSPRNIGNDFRDYLPNSGSLAFSSNMLHEIAGIIIYGWTGKAKY